MKNKQRIVIVILSIIILMLLGTSYYFYQKSEQSGIEYISVDNEDELTNNETTSTSSIPNKSESSEVTKETSVTAYITSIEGNKITLDYVDYLSGKEAEKAAIEDGRCNPEQIDSYCFPNGTVYFRNNNPKLRTFEVSPTVQIKTATAFNRTPTGIAIISLAELKNILATQIQNETNMYVPYTVTLSSNNQVTKIIEIFRP